MYDPKQFSNVNATAHKKWLKLTPALKEVLKLQLLLFAIAMSISFLLFSYAAAYVASGYLLLALVACIAGVVTGTLPIEAAYRWLTGFPLLAGIMAAGLISVDFNWIWVLTVCCFYLPLLLSIMWEGIGEWPKPEVFYLNGLVPAAETKKRPLFSEEGYAAIRFNLLLPDERRYTVAYPVDWAVARSTSWRAVLSSFLQYAQSSGDHVDMAVLDALSVGPYTMHYRDLFGRRHYLNAEVSPTEATGPGLPRIRIKGLGKADVHFVRTVTVTLLNQ